MFFGQVNAHENFLFKGSTGETESWGTIKHFKKTLISMGKKLNKCRFKTKARILFGPNFF